MEPKVNKINKSQEIAQNSKKVDGVNKITTNPEEATKEVNTKKSEIKDEKGSTENSSRQDQNIKITAGTGKTILTNVDDIAENTETKDEKAELSFETEDGKEELLLYTKILVNNNEEASHEEALKKIETLLTKALTSDEKDLNIATKLAYLNLTNKKELEEGDEEYLGKVSKLLLSKNNLKYLNSKKIKQDQAIKAKREIAEVEKQAIEVNEEQIQSRINKVRDLKIGVDNALTGNPPDPKLAQEKLLELKKYIFDLKSGKDVDQEALKVALKANGIEAKGDTVSTEEINKLVTKVEADVKKKFNDAFLSKFKSLYDKGPGDDRVKNIIQDRLNDGEINLEELSKYDPASNNAETKKINAIILDDLLSDKNINKSDPAVKELIGQLEKSLGRAPSKAEILETTTKPGKSDELVTKKDFLVFSDTPYNLKSNETFTQRVLNSRYNSLSSDEIDKLFYERKLEVLYSVEETRLPLLKEAGLEKEYRAYVQKQEAQAEKRGLKVAAIKRRVEEEKIENRAKQSRIDDAADEEVKKAKRKTEARETELKSETKLKAEQSLLKEKEKQISQIKDLLNNLGLPIGLIGPVAISRLLNSNGSLYEILKSAGMTDEMLARLSNFRSEVIRNIQTGKSDIIVNRNVINNNFPELKEYFIKRNDDYIIQSSTVRQIQSLTDAMLKEIGLENIRPSTASLNIISKANDLSAKKKEQSKKESELLANLTWQSSIPSSRDSNGTKEIKAFG